MRAVRIDGQTPGGKRSILAKVIPLSAPYLVQIFPVYGCNFKCKYCIHSVPRAKRNFISDNIFMDFNLYKKCIDDLCKFNKKIKMLRFAGTGEPLLHKDIVNMIKYAAERQVASSIDIVTNGKLLTPEISLGLVNAGISKIRISLQGLNAYKYKQISGVTLDYDKFIENLKYLYKHRKSTKIYIKIIDCALDENQQSEFFEMFGDICDYIAIEHMFPSVSQINYSKISKNSVNSLTQNGVTVQNVQICPQPFYLMQINPDGNVAPCCSMETAYITGNVKTESLYEIWNNNKYNYFREMQLLKKKENYAICKKCNEYKYAMFKEDNLDKDFERLQKLFS